MVLRFSSQCALCSLSDTADTRGALLLSNLIPSLIPSVSLDASWMHGLAQLPCSGTHSRGAGGWCLHSVRRSVCEQRACRPRHAAPLDVRRRRGSSSAPLLPPPALPCICRLKVYLSSEGGRLHVDAGWGRHSRVGDARGDAVRTESE